MDESSALQRLNFGYEDAERDITGGLLRASFIRTVAYEATVSGRKMLIIGRKGSGKSAICVQIAAGGMDLDGTILITPDDAVGNEIRRFELQGLTGDTARSLVWRYLFAACGPAPGRGSRQAANQKSQDDQNYAALSEGQR